MKHTLLLAALMSLSLNAQAYGINMLNPISPFYMGNQYHTHVEPIRTYKCNTVPPVKKPCKTPCSVCFKDGKQIPCKK